MTPYASARSCPFNCRAVEELIRTGYREVTARYRQDDEIEVTTENYRRVRANLRELCEAFPHPIRALDVGCGTGRYFHCLTNVRELVGIDVTGEMLEAAEHPVRAREITVGQIRLAQTNAYLADFPPGSFQLIYSLGMFGNGCPVTVEICNRFHQWLVPGGKLYFNTVDVAGLPLQNRVRRLARRLLYPLLPGPWQRKLDARESRHPFFGLPRRGLEEILRQTLFEDFQVKSHVCRSPLWSGRHLECMAGKG